MTMLKQIINRVESDPKPLQDCVVAITGASSGIGRAVGIAMAARGAQLYLVGRHVQTLEPVLELARKSTPRAQLFRADLTQDEDISALVDRIHCEHGQLNVLVHSAGLIFHNEHAKASISELDSLYRSNVRGPYLLTQKSLPLLRAGLGQIVFINSSSGLRARASAGQFSATQHAMKAIADSLRDEVNADGIRVLTVFPGRTATPRTEKLFHEEGKAYRPELLIQPEDVATMVLHALSLPRSAEVTEISIRPLCKSY